MPKQRKYRVVDSFGNGVSVTDGTSPFLRFAALQYPNEFRRAARHTAFILSKDIKKGLRKGNLDGIVIPPTKPLKTKAKRRLKSNGDKSAKFKHIRKRRRFTGNRRNRNLVRSIGYESLKDGARVGWLSKSAAIHGQAVQGALRGKKPRFDRRLSQPVTNRMRKYFSAIGIGLKKTTTRITQQPADVIEPFYRKRLRWILTNTEERLRKNIAKSSLRELGVRA